MLEKNDKTRKSNLGILRGLDSFKTNESFLKEENMRMMLIKDIKEGKLKKQPI